MNDKRIEYTQAVIENKLVSFIKTPSSPSEEVYPVSSFTYGKKTKQKIEPRNMFAKYPILIFDDGCGTYNPTS